MAARDAVERVPAIAWNWCPSSVECATSTASVCWRRLMGLKSGTSPSSPVSRNRRSPPLAMAPRTGGVCLARSAAAHLTALSASGRSGWKERQSWVADPAFRPAWPPISTRGQSRSSTRPGAGALRCRLVTSWSCGSEKSVCSCNPAIILDSRDESLRPIRATEPTSVIN